MLKLRIPWLRPVLRTDEERNHDHKTSWLELFYDLVFIAIVAQFASRFSEHPSLFSAFENILLFLPILWSWLGFVFYNDRFESEDLSQRFFTTFKMIIIILIALFIQSDSSFAGPTDIVWSYVALRILLIFMWVRAGWHNPQARPLTNRYAFGFSISVVLWISSLYTYPETGLWLRALGFSIDLFTPMFTLKVQSQLPKITSSHFPERFGLLFLIALGEIIAKVVHGRMIASSGTTNSLIVFGVFFCVVNWLIYFDQIMGEKLKSMAARAFWVYMHLPLILGLIGFAGGYHYLGEHHDAWDGTARWILSVTFALVFGAFALIQMALPSITLHRKLHIIFCATTALTAILVNAFTSDVTPAVFLLLIGGFAILPASLSFIEVEL